MRKKGLEPPRREAPDPKSGAATNYATSAVRIFLRVANIVLIDRKRKVISCFFNPKKHEAEYHPITILKLL